MKTMLGGMVVAVLLAGPAAAQTGRVYVGGVFGAHSERADHVKGHTAAVGVVGGVRLTRSWGIEVEVGRPMETLARESTAVGIAFPPANVALPLSSTDQERYGVLERFTRERTVRSTVAVGAVYQPRVHPRWQPRLFMGVYNSSVSDRFATQILRLPTQVDPVQLARVTPTDQRHTRNLGGLSLGAGLGFAVTPHLSIAPEFRYDYGSIGDEINNALRSSVRAVWSF